jgi:hypothetical protein
MATAFTGSLGWTALHPVQLGGPPLVSTWDRPLAVKAGPLGSSALPLLAHAYLNDGVTPAPTATFPILNRPALKTMTANGGQDQITIEVAGIPKGAAVWGSSVYGSHVWGGVGLGLEQGNVIRLTEVGGPWKGVIYSGIVEGFPDVRTSAGVSHGILLSPFGWELGRVPTQLVYTAPTDVVQTVRDAVAQTQHCSCDPVSVPASTGVFVAVNGAVDYRGQKVQQVLDAARSILGPTWFWHCDELGRVWLQPQGSPAVYTLMGGADYEDRTSNGGSIVDRINQVPAVGGVPDGGSANITAIANGASQGALGVRTLDPPIQAPGITDQTTLNLIAIGVLGTLDQTWTRVSLTALPGFGKRIHMSQPGGATVRYWEPGVTPLPETGAVAGYVGPFICQQVEHDGLRQTIEAGSIPVTSSTDVDNLVQSLVSRGALNAFQVAGASLSTRQVLTGTFQSGTGSIVQPSGPPLPAGLWRLDPTMFQAFDPAGVARLQEGNLPLLGSSPAGWGIRVNDASGAPIMDSFGLFGTAKPLNFAAGGPNQSIVGTGAANKTVITGSAYSITIPNIGGRAQNIMLWLYATAKTSGGSGTLAYIRANIVGFNSSADLAYDKGVTGLVSGSLWFFPVGGIPPGTYTVQMEGAADTGQTLLVSGFFHQIWIAGSTG